MDSGTAKLLFGGGVSGSWLAKIQVLHTQYTAEKSIAKHLHDQSVAHHYWQVIQYCIKFVTYNILQLRFYNAQDKDGMRSPKQAR
jgi:hypothetical protein